MTITDVTKDIDAQTMTVTCEFDAPVERVWKLWEDPRLLERWWGPPSYPATFVEHDFVAGGRSHYYMTGPEGDQPHGVWRIVSVDAPRSAVFEDAFADEAGTPNPDMPSMTMRLTLAPMGKGTRMTVVTTFPSPEAMQKVLEMGAEEGMRQAMSQIDGILREVGASA